MVPNRPLLIATLLLAVTAGNAAAAPPTAVVLFGKGVQVYGCTETDGAYAWRFKAPDAELSDVAGNPAGRHFAGPSWEAADGSTVTGEPLVTSAAPQPRSIPWLVLRAKAHTGDGVFAHTAFIVRSVTEGGVAPAGGCDAAHAGAEARVGYTATYTFFPG